MARKHFEFQFLIYRILVQEKKHGGVQAVAKRMNMSYSTLYHYLEGEVTFPVDLVAPLYNATKDPEILNFILDDTDMMLTSREDGDGAKSTLMETLDAAAAVGELVAKVQAAIEDDAISPQEKVDINKAINKAQKELEDLKKKVRR